MNSLAGIDMGRILLDLSNEVIKQLDDLECSVIFLVRTY
ncbi:YiiF protein [Escherichia coli]|uniref:YiiF protein n=1 Tax=Escherichia coli TaxID=562 RepID=A0A377E0M8_ECOLX|nr:YiiF protein [Escherichia coli]